MKKLIIVSLLLTLSGCKYGSQFEAMEACKKNWNGKTEVGVQYCQIDEATNKVLGIRWNSEKKVIKRFKY